MGPRGSYAAYSQLTPLKGDVSDDLAKQDELGFQHRAEKRTIDAIAKAEEEKKRARKDALREKIVKDLPNYDTGSRSLNEVQGKLIQKALNEYGPIIKILEDPKASDDDKLKAQLRAQNIGNLPENLKLVTDFYTNQDVLYRKGVLDKKLHRNPDYEKIFQSGFDNYVLDLDENGLPVAAFIDKNKDGKTDILDVQPYEQIKTGLPSFNFQPLYDKEDLVKEAITKIQPEVNQVVKGDRIIKTTALDEKAVDKHVNDLLYSSDGTPSDVLKSFARTNGVDLTDAKGLQGIKDDFVNSMNLYAKGGREESANPEYRQNQEFQYKKSQDAKKELPTSFNTVETPPIYKESNIVSANGYKTVSVMNGKPIPILEAYINNKKKAFTNATLNSYTVVKNRVGNRRIAAEIVYQDSKGSVLSPEEELTLKDENSDPAARELVLAKVNKGAENKTAIVYLTEKDAVKYAKQMKLKNASDMANKAKVGEKSNSNAIKVGYEENGYRYLGGDPSDAKSWKKI